MLAALALPVMALAQVGPTEESQASEIFKVGASLRLRGAIRDDLKFGSTDPGNDEQYLLTQLRVNATWNPATRARVFVEIQDARIFGEEGIDQDAIPNIFVDELDLHQGYLRVDLSSGELPVDITVGRQKFAFGAQRLVSPLEWVNTARVWDGVRLDLGRAN